MILETGFMIYVLILRFYELDVMNKESALQLEFADVFKVIRNIIGDRE